jgi:hypothetical protein
MRKYVLLFSIVLVLTVSCSAPTAETTAPAADDAAPPYDNVATIRDIMATMIDPAADYVWNSVGTEVSAAGIKEKFPKNPEEWAEERRHALLLVEAVNLLMMPGRKVAKPGEKSANPGIELEPAEVEALIAKDRPKFLKLARELQVVALAQLKAAENKDVPGLMTTGGEIEPACENCHKIYWYPNDPFYKDQKAAEPAAEKK